MSDYSEWRLRRKGIYEKMGEMREKHMKYRVVISVFIVTLATFITRHEHSRHLKKP